MPRRFLAFIALALVALTPAATLAQVNPTAVISGPSPLSVGQDLVASGASSFAGPGATIVRYTWRLDTGSPVVTAAPSITITAASGLLPIGAHTLSLVVTDDAGNQSSADSLRVVVQDDVTPTAVVRGPASILLGQSLTVTGDRSFDSGGTITEYRWTLDALPPVITSTPSTTFPATSLPLGQHTVQLVVVDDSGNQSSPDALLVTVVQPDTERPTAVLDAPGTVAFGVPFTLDGSRSFDVGGRIVEYRWTVGSNAPVVTTTNTFVVNTPLPPGTHVMQLVVVDDSGNQSTSDAVSVRVTDGAPTAVITAPATAPFGRSFSVSGSRSFDLEGPIVRYTWTVDALSPVVTTTPDFTVTVDPAAPLALGAHTIQLVVRDASGNDSAPDVVHVIVADLDAPTAVLDAPAFVAFGSDIAVTGARSADSGGGRIVEYRWTLDGGVPAVTAAPSFTFVAPAGAPFAPGLHAVSLEVVDDSGNVSQPASAQVRVLDGVAPTAVITAPASIVSGLTLAVSGDRSFDIGGTVRQWTWSLDGGAPVVTSGPDFTVGVAGVGALNVGPHTITLSVTDDSGNQSSTDRAQVLVLPPPDGVPPVVTLTTPADGAIYALGQSVAAAFSCSDADSGIASCAGTVTPGAAIDTASIGTKTFTVRAVDVAGNVTTVTHGYTVGYVFTGFFAPVDNLPTINAGNAGRTFPIKWRLADASGRPITSLASFVDLRDSAIACDASPEDVLEEQFTATAASTLQYDAAADQFIYHWRTSKSAVGCRLLQVTLADGSKHWAKFRLR